MENHNEEDLSKMKKDDLLKQFSKLKKDELVDKLSKDSEKDMRKTGFNVWTYTTILILALFVAYILINASTKQVDQNILTEKGSQVVEINGKAAIVYNYPVIDLKIVQNMDCTEAECPINAISANIERSVPGTKTSLIDKNSDEGKQLIEDYKLEYTPSFLFSKSIEQFPEFEKMKNDLESINDFYLLKIERIEPIKIEYFEEIPDIEGVSAEYQNLVKSIIREGKQENILPEGANMKGVSGDGEITIVEFSDFECPFCQRFAKETYPLLFEEYGDQLKFYFADYIVPSHARGVPAALAAECAGAQGKYFEMHDILFNNDEWKKTTDNALFKQFATDLSLDTTQFNNCVDNEELIANVRLDQDFATQIGVQASPTIFVNGYKVEGAYPFEVIKALIEFDNE